MSTQDAGYNPTLIKLKAQLTQVQFEQLINDSVELSKAHSKLTELRNALTDAQAETAAVQDRLETLSNAACAAVEGASVDWTAGEAKIPWREFVALADKLGVTVRQP